MKPRTLTAAIACALALAACATNPPYGDPYYNSTSQGTYTQYGRVVAIDTIAGENRPSGAGAVIGGVVGGVLGHQIGSGRGNDAATVAGAVGGAVVGNEMERRRAAGDPDYRIEIRLESGRVLTLVQDTPGGLRVGDRVRVEGGRIYRL